MAKYKWALSFAILIAASGLIFANLVGNDSMTSEAVAAGAPDPQDAQDIQAVILQAYALYDEAGRTFDTSQFPSVFADDFSVPLSADQHRQLQEWLGVDPPGAGYLTYVRAAYANRERGALLLERAMTKAKAEGRDFLTGNEWMEVVRLNGERPPAPRSQSSMSVQEAQAGLKSRIRYDSISITGNKATVVFDTGATLNKAMLVQRDGKWYIAGVERLAVTG